MYKRLCDKSRSFKIKHNKFALINCGQYFVISNFGSGFNIFIKITNRNDY